ncbi:MAG: SDR family oxidoreductase [Spirochaetes bacterium]|nr:SDR family oxidoreductase [Spirochaetota bacterium]
MDKQNPFAGKRVMVAGGTSGIGLAVAQRASDYFDEVVLVSRNSQKRSHELKTLFKNENVKFIDADMSSRSDISDLFKKTGKIDHLVITFRPELTGATFFDIQDDQAKKAFDLKFWGQYNLVKTAALNFNKGGSIVMTSGIAGQKTYKGSLVMSVINSAVETMCRVLALELAPLRINTVSPGFVEPKSDEIQKVTERIPVKRIAFAEEAVLAYMYLMENGYITGTVLTVDGGALLV